MAIKEVELIEIVNNKKEILEICDRTAARCAQKGLTLSNPEVITLPVVYFIEEAIKKINEMKEHNSTVELDLFGLLDIGIDHRVYEEDENDGNYVPYATPGVAFKVLIKDDGSTADLAE